jgi:hypothetical protein
MPTPFDQVVEAIKMEGYHRHRGQAHSNIVSLGIFNDLLRICDAFREDFAAKRVNRWLNVRTPGARQRKIDLLVGEPLQDGDVPNLERLRVCVENKSVMTAHRNRDARFDDLMESLQVLHRVRPEAVLVATVMVGVASRFLNIPDKVKSFYRGRLGEFESKVLPRLSTGDESLWTEFSWAVSENDEDDPMKTVERFRQLPTRQPGHTHALGYDYVLLAPVHVDNVNPPRVARGTLGIDVDKEYERMLDVVCKAYMARWHLK